MAAVEAVLVLGSSMVLGSSVVLKSLCNLVVSIDSL